MVNKQTTLQLCHQALDNLNREIEQGRNNISNVSNIGLYIRRTPATGMTHVHAVATVKLRITATAEEHKEHEDIPVSTYPSKF